MRLLDLKKVQAVQLSKTGVLIKEFSIIRLFLLHPFVILAVRRLQSYAFLAHKRTMKADATPKRKQFHSEGFCFEVT